MANVYRQDDGTVLATDGEMGGIAFIGTTTTIPDHDPFREKLEWDGAALYVIRGELPVAQYEQRRKISARAGDVMQGAFPGMRPEDAVWECLNLIATNRGTDPRVGTIRNAFQRRDTAFGSINAAANVAEVRNVTWEGTLAAAQAHGMAASGASEYGGACGAAPKGETILGRLMVAAATVGEAGRMLLQLRKLLDGKVDRI